MDDQRPAFGAQMDAAEEEVLRKLVRFLCNATELK